MKGVSSKAWAKNLRKEFVKRGMPHLQSFGVEQDRPKENDGVVNTK